MNNYYIISLKYHPGLLKEFQLLKRNFEKDSRAMLILSRGYKKINLENQSCYLNNGVGIKGMLKDLVKFPVHFHKLIQNVGSKEGVNKFVFYNPHPLNFLYALGLRIFIQHCVVCTTLHEPYKSNSEKIQYGILIFFYFLIVQITQALSIRLSHKIITMSPYGSFLFKENFKSFKGIHIEANILLPINHKRSEEKSDNTFFSFIGTVNKAKGFYEFIDLVNYTIQHKSSIKYFLITSSNISEFIPLFDKQYKSALTIISKPNIKDEEIEHVILKSKAIFSIHNVAAQSGVLPLAYSLSRPVIMRDLPAFIQYKIDNKLVVSEKFKTADLFKLCLFLDKDKKYLKDVIIKSRMAFDKYFSEKNFHKYYHNL